MSEQTSATWLMPPNSNSVLVFPPTLCGLITIGPPGSGHRQKPNLTSGSATPSGPDRLVIPVASTTTPVSRRSPTSSTGRSITGRPDNHDEIDDVSNTWGHQRVRRSGFAHRPAGGLGRPSVSGPLPPRRGP